ncbi:MAG: HAD-IB family phosphatase [Candidatus Bathyarchaeota archaeon]|nr:MAG: HAD-IB family phosphatase [Candidatus Bathyarchaeota archaeon]
MENRTDYPNAPIVSIVKVLFHDVISVIDKADEGRNACTYAKEPFSPSNIIVLCDFDGTAVNIDTCQFILDRFAGSGWRTFDQQYERGEISLEKNMRLQFSTVKAPWKQVLNQLEEAAEYRKGFPELVNYCGQRNIPVIIVSAGIDFVIGHLLKMKSWENSLDVHAPRAIHTAQGIRFVFPSLTYKTSENFKDDLVRNYKKENRIVFYIGDGAADYHAAVEADFRFAIEGSKLAELLRLSSKPFTEIESFESVVSFIEYCSEQLC